MVNSVNQLGISVNRYLNKRRVYKRDIEEIDSMAQTCVAMIDTLRTSVFSLHTEDFEDIDYELSTHLDQIRIDMRYMNYTINVIRYSFSNLKSQNDVYYYEYIDTVISTYKKLINTYIGQSCVHIENVYNEKIAS